MTLAPLATISDLTSRGVTVSVAEEPVVMTYLDVASSAVRDAAGCPISQTTETVDLEGQTGPRLRLPGPPVSAVSSVLLDGTAVTDYELTGGALWRSCGWQPGTDPSLVTVTYTHGLPTAPADIVDLVCRLAAQALVNYRNEAALTAKTPMQERIGDYSATYAYESQFSEMELPDKTRRRIAARFGNSVGMVKTR